MLETPPRTHGRNVGGNPMSFFAISNLYTIEEGSLHSKSATFDSLSVEVLSASAHSRSSEGITALPRWEEIQSPRRTHIRYGSQDPVLEKAIYAKESEMGPGGNRSGASTPASQEHPRHSRMMVWLVLVVVVVLALAIILGAVLGTFVSPGGHHSAPRPSITEIPAGATPTPTATPTGGAGSPEPTPTPITHIQSLAVTGWSVPGPEGYFTVWLFSQDENGYLSRHTFNSSTGNWTRVSNFVSAKPGTPLAATSLNADYYAGQPNYSFPDTHYQAEVAYLDENNHINEFIFPDSGPAIGQPGSLNQQKYIALEETELAFYWPKLIYQGMSGEVREARFECHRKNECWHDNVLRTTDASNGTRLASVPMQNNESSTGLFYQEEGGRFVNYKEDNGEAMEIWANKAFSDRIRPNSSVTAFSTTRPNSDSALNTHLLWQDTDGTIQMSWTEDDVGWRSPRTYAAFAGADNNTALTCLTGLTFPGFPLSTGTELSRCYFQTGGAVREVSFDGTSWDVVGNVPTFGF